MPLLCFVFASIKTWTPGAQLGCKSSLLLNCCWLDGINYCLIEIISSNPFKAKLVDSNVLITLGVNNLFNPYPVLGVYMTPIDFFLINKNGSLRLSGIKFCDFFYII